jgi:2-oxoglutarate ferredoxin oxidoreductase subunit alpha
MSVDSKQISDASDDAHKVREAVVIRFAGDSGDGMQLAGAQFTIETALFGEDLATFPDYPAEIRAPAGTEFGVSAFQVQFGSADISTPGDELDVLFAMNPAALKANLSDLRVGGTVIVDKEAFNARNLAKAGYDTNPLTEESYAQYELIQLNIGQMAAEAVADFDLSQKEASRSRNMWTLGLALWLYDRDRSATVEWLRHKFSARPEIAEANIAALNAGHAYGETAEMPSSAVGHGMGKAQMTPGEYRVATGTQTLTLGLLAAAKSAGLQIFLGSYPITPASPILHMLANMKGQGVITFQAEDEIAAVCSAIGASYAGALGVTSSSGPGIALKTEAIGLAISAELPLVIVNTQRAGPSTGMPTKAEQSDLFQAVYGRNADAPLPVLAASTPSDCFEVAVEAVRLATKYMTPVFFLTDSYLANAAEPWHLPDLDKLPELRVAFLTGSDDASQLQRRNPNTLARSWIVPGTPGLEHRTGGLEKDVRTGHISYDPDNHQYMTDIRAAKIGGIGADIPLQEVTLGPESGPLALVGWGSTFGPIRQATRRARDKGLDISHIHIRYLNPFPPNLGELLKGFEKILVPEMNTGQLLAMLKSTFLVPAEGLSKVTGQPFKIAEILDAITAIMEA